MPGNSTAPAARSTTTSAFGAVLLHKPSAHVYLAASLEETLYQEDLAFSKSSFFRIGSLSKYYA